MTSTETFEEIHDPHGEEELASFIEARSDAHRAMGRDDLRALALDGDNEAAWELARRAQNKARKRARYSR